jgi:N-acetylmuramoyl-L-alanine amidase
MKRISAVFFLTLLSGCALGPPLDRTFTASSQDSRAQFLIIHHTAESFDSSLKTLTKGPVSSHYLVDIDPPTIYRLVDEDRRAYHAGVSSWKGQTMLNAASIGIEIVNRGDHKLPDGTVVFDEYPKAQVDAVIDLVKWIVRRHEIRPDRILGHSDIAPQRKVDPGPTFPWKRLADEGLINWPDEKLVAERRAKYENEVPDVAWFQKKLATHGFAVPSTGTLDPQTRRVISAFQMKYRPTLCLGDPDAETAAILDVMTSPPANAP